jgi:hypothetical protein
LFFGLEKTGQQVITGLVPAPGDKVAEVNHRLLPGCRVPFLEPRWPREGRVEPSCGDRGPLLELLYFVRRHAEHLADHQDRERESQVAYHFYPGAGLGLVKDLVHDLLGMGAELVDPFRCKSPAYQPT